MSSVPSFNFKDMISSLSQHVQGVKDQLALLQDTSSGTVNLGTMFTMQFKMQVMSQFTEAVSNTLSAVHNEMVTMARATKGQ